MGGKERVFPQFFNSPYSLLGIKLPKEFPKNSSQEILILPFQPFPRNRSFPGEEGLKFFLPFFPLVVHLKKFFHLTKRGPTQGFPSILPQFWPKRFIFYLPKTRFNFLILPLQIIGVFFPEVSKRVHFFPFFWSRVSPPQFFSPGGNFKVTSFGEGFQTPQGKGIWVSFLKGIPQN